MNRALWSKAWLEARWMLAGCALLMFLFHWLFVWITNLIPMPTYLNLVGGLPPEIKRMLGPDVENYLTHGGRIALGYIDPVVLFLSAVWGISRGSDAVSGEIGRGTMEMLLAQPVRRLTVLLIPVAVMVAGAAALAVSAWLGTFVGLALVDFGPDVVIPTDDYVPAALNLFALTFFTAAIATLASSWDRYRWRTVGLVGAVYVVQLVMKMISRMVESLDWMMWTTFLGAYQPQILATEPEQVWELSLRYNGVLLGLGLLAFVLSAVIFCRRDLPAPL